MVANCRPWSLLKRRLEVRLFLRGAHQFCRNEEAVPGSRSATLWESPKPDIDFLLKVSNRLMVTDNLCKRLKLEEDAASSKVDRLVELRENAISHPCEGNRRKLVAFATDEFPNLTHPSVKELVKPTSIYRSSYESWQPKDRLKDGHFVRPFEDVSKTLGNLVRTQHMGQICSERSYFLFGKIAELEQALIRYTVDRLVHRHGYTLVSVPDLIHPEIIKRCGMEVDGERTQVFRLEPRFYGDVALSGTAEMSFGGLFMGKQIEFEKNKAGGIKRFVAVSRCYRAESSKGRSERGIYRVHHFNKVEMFGLMPGRLELSNFWLDQFLEVQKELFEGLDLYFRVLDMPPCELGNPAFRKYDIEALFPGRKNTQKEKMLKDAKNGKLDGDEDFYGEISSCSNCTDFQSRRLNIRDAETGQFVHTINGTACALPRMIMAIVEQNQTATGSVEIPMKLRKYMKDATHIEPSPKKSRPNFLYIRSPKNVLGRLKKSPS